MQIIEATTRSGATVYLSQIGTGQMAPRFSPIRSEAFRFMHLRSAKVHRDDALEYVKHAAIIEIGQ